MPSFEADLFSMHMLLSAAHFLPMPVIALLKVVVFCTDRFGQEPTPAKCYRVNSDESGLFGFTECIEVGPTPVLYVWTGR